MLFDPDDQASLLKRVLPDVQWEVVNGVEALAYDDFASIMLEGAMVLRPLAAGSAPDDFGPSGLLMRQTVALRTSSERFAEGRRDLQVELLACFAVDCVVRVCRVS